MRAMFALVLTAGVAAGAALLMWDQGDAAPRTEPFEPGPNAAGGEPDPGAGASADDPGGDVRRVANPGSSDAPARREGGAVTPPGRADAVAARMRENLQAGEPEVAARAILRDEAKLLADPEVRALALRTADELVLAAASLPTESATARRMDARRIYAAVYDCDQSSSEQADRAFEGCRTLHRTLITGAAAPEELVLRQTIRAGDSLWKLARGPWKEAGVSAETGFVLHVNGISDARRIRAGQTLRVPKEAVSLLVRKSRFELTLLLGGAPFERFPVGLGADDSTPEGVFHIETKIENPDWYYGGRKIPFGDPENVIGTRWMGFAGDPAAEGIGIHGTNDETTVGKAVSLGCIRMKRKDVETLFEWVSRRTQVDVRR